jgi:hypothetical protein
MSVEGFDAVYHPMTGCAGATTSSKRVVLAGSRMHVLQAESAEDALLTDTVREARFEVADVELCLLVHCPYPAGCR